MTQSVAPLFSVITPCYNAQKKLEKTYRSLSGFSTECSLEYLVIDGASTDGTMDWLSSQDQSALRWISEKDTGVYDAMNKGITLARGRFLLFLGAGDKLLPRGLKLVSDYIKRNGSKIPRFIYGDVQEMDTGLQCSAGTFSKSRICRENICHQGIFYERTLFELLGKYELRYPLMADWAFNLKCWGDKRVKKIHLPCEIAEFEGNGISSTSRDIPFAQDRLQLIKERIGLAHAFRYRLEEAIKRRMF